jgi:aconitate hydratase
MGILPLQFRAGESAASHGLDGRESYSIRGLETGIVPGQEATVEVTRDDGSSTSFPVTVRIDAPTEVEIFANGGILPMVVRQMLAG